MKVEGEQGGAFSPELVESGEEAEHDLIELVFGAVKSCVDNFLAQEFSQALHQVQLGRTGRQEDLGELAYRPATRPISRFCSSGHYCRPRKSADHWGGRLVATHIVGGC